MRDKALDLWKNRGKNLHPASQKPQKQEDLQWSEVFKVLRNQDFLREMKMEGVCCQICLARKS